MKTPACVLILWAAGLGPVRAQLVTAVINDTISLPPTGSVVIADLLSSRSWLLVDGRGERRRLPVRVESSEEGGRGSHGNTYVYRGEAAFPDTGSYRAALHVEGIGEDHLPFSFEKTWRVRVSIPVLHAPLTVDTAYYPGESATISFATREFKDASLYGYEVRALHGDTSLVMQGEGSCVCLDSLLTEPNAAMERMFLVRGLYGGRPFRFVNPRTREVEASAWTIRVRKPALTIVTPWDDPQTFRSGAARFDMHQRVDWGPLQFRCVLLARRGNAWLHLAPRPPRSVSVTANPPEFLPALPRARFTVDLGAPPWYIIDLRPSPEFLAGIGPGKHRDVAITIHVETQFGEKATRTFMASVY